jgi:hypothetical protein
LLANQSGKIEPEKPKNLLKNFFTLNNNSSCSNLHNQQTNGYTGKTKKPATNKTR